MNKIKAGDWVECVEATTRQDQPFALQKGEIYRVEAITDSDLLVIEDKPISGYPGINYRYSAHRFEPLHPLKANVLLACRENDSK